MDKTVLVTGSSRGIGRETARLFGSRGWRVVVNYFHSGFKGLQIVGDLRNIGCEAFAVEADVANLAQVERMIGEITARYGNVDLLVNNAGYAQQKLFCDITPAEWERMFAVTVTGAYNCIRCVLPSMIARHTGKIINVSSMWGVVGASCETHYSAAKAALIGLTKALAKEVGPSGITVNCVAPGVIDSDMCASLEPAVVAALRADTPLGRLGTPAEVARTICFLAENDFFTGQVLCPNGGFAI